MLSVPNEEQDIRVAAPPQQPTLSDAVESQPSLDEKVEQQALLGALQLNRGPAIHTNLTHRMDRLPFAPFHLYIVLALGISWILDGMVMFSSFILSEWTKKYSPNTTKPDRSVYHLSNIIHRKLH
jgi:hypothetical protein